MGGMDERPGAYSRSGEEGGDLSGNTDEMVAKFSYCVSDRLLAGDTLKKAVQRCLVEIRDLI